MISCIGFRAAFVAPYSELGPQIHAVSMTRWHCLMHRLLAGGRHAWRQCLWIGSHNHDKCLIYMQSVWGAVWPVQGVADHDFLRGNALHVLARLRFGCFSCLSQLKQHCPVLQESNLRWHHHVRDLRAPARAARMSKRHVQAHRFLAMDKQQVGALMLLD